MAVVLCTWNGERYLAEQLRSILAQQRLPDQLVVSDDGSTDGTLDIVDLVLGPASVPWHVVRTPRRLGAAANFEYALSYVDADVVAFCDQDDVWLPERLAVGLRVMQETGAAAVFADAWLIDAAGVRTGERFWPSVGFRGRARASFERDPFSVLLKQNPVCGAALLASHEALGAALPFSTHALHDQWIALVLAGNGAGIAAVDNPLIEYRVHAANQVGVRFSSPFARLRRRRERGASGDELALFEEAAAKLETSGVMTAALRARFAAKISHLRHRAELPESRPARVARCSVELAAGRYHRYSRGWESFLFDAFFR